MKIQPAVRVFLTFLVAGLSTAVATVDDETFRIIAGICLSGLAAIGIVPPQVPTRTSIDSEDRRVNVVSEDGQADVHLLLVIAIAVGVLLLLFGVRFD